LRLHGTGQLTVKSQFCVFGDIGTEAQGFEDDVDGEEQTQSDALSSEDEDEGDGDEELEACYSQKQIR
jgi:hypothetical protein